jgi:hypothetical protein
VLFQDWQVVPSVLLDLWHVIVAKLRNNENQSLKHVHQQLANNNAAAVT